MFEYLCRVETILRVVPTHLLEDRFEDRRSVHSAVNLPKVLLALDSQLFVVGVVDVSSAERLEFHP